MLTTIGFVSTATFRFPDVQIERILKAISHKNHLQNINGIMVYSEGNIFVVLEGEEEKVNYMFNSYKKNALHSKIITVFKQPMKKIKCCNPQFLAMNLTSQTPDLEKITGNLINPDPSTLRVVKEVLKAFDKAGKAKKQEFLMDNEGKGKI